MVLTVRTNSWLNIFSMENQNSLKEQFISSVYRDIDENIDNENYSVEDLARSVRLSRSMLHRKLKKITGKSAGDLITLRRLEKARELLLNDVATVSEIAYRVGFNSPSYFNKVFKKHYKVSPGEVKRYPEKYLPPEPGPLPRGEYAHGGLRGRELFRRRVPQTLAIYFIAGWFILMVIQWLVKNYPISPHLVNVYLVALAGMIPTVILLAYYHGKPGQNPWTMVEKIGIPTNVILTALVLLFLFRGKDLGATTTSVLVTDEKGQQTERVIPKSEFRKKLAIFSLENQTGDTAYEWMMHAIPDMIRVDLIQDMYLDIKAVYELYEEIREEGFPDATGIPLILKKKIAEQQYMDYFITGTLSHMDDQLSVNIVLHETSTTKSLAERSFSGNEILKTVDEISVWVKEELSVPARHIARTVDLPASEIFTNSSLALKTLYIGMNECYINENWEKGMAFLGQSVQMDTTFAYGYEKVFIVNMRNARSEESFKAVDKLMDLLYKLPERTQFRLKWFYYYYVNEDADLARKVIDSWIELYPQDVNALGHLADDYIWRGQRDDAIAVYNKILKLDPQRYEHLLDIAQIYSYLGDFNEALHFYQRYANAFPDNSRPFIILGLFHSDFGKHEQARSYYEKAMLIEPDDISILLKLARNKREMGEFDSALSDYEEILKKCNTPQDRVEVYHGLEDYHFIRGEVNKAIYYIELGLKEKEKYDPRYDIINSRANKLVRYIVAGKTEVAFQFAREIENLGPPFDQMILWTYMEIYLELEDPEGIEEYLEKIEEYSREMGIELNRAYLSWARGTIHEARGEYETAIQYFQKCIELYPNSMGWKFHIGRLYRMNQQYKKAEEYFQQIIDYHPFWPEELYEFGLLYAEWGKHDKAREYLNRALDIWENADSIYKPAMLARQKLEELEAGFI